MAVSANLGFPRLGLKREWKKASERYWSGKINLDELVDTADMLTEIHWELQKSAGIDVIPCNDFAFYDLMLDTAVLVGAIPPRYTLNDCNEVDIDTYFAMARGRQDETTDVTAMEMTKWFDTNYHYIVPEFYKNTDFKLSSNHPFSAIERAHRVGVEKPRPVIIGPASFILLGKCIDDGIELPALMDSLVAVYKEVFKKFSEMGIEWVQVDEPVLTLDLDSEEQGLFHQAYKQFNSLNDRPKMMITTYFGTIEHNIDLVKNYGEGLHLDLVRAPGQMEKVLSILDDRKVVSLGVVDGRNVWRVDLDKQLAALQKAAELLGSTDRIQVAPSCSLLHCPIDLDIEEKLDPEIKQWMAFGKQKLEEINLLTEALNGNMEKVSNFFDESRESLNNRSKSPRVNNAEVQKRLASIDEGMTYRQTKFQDRVRKQQEKLNLPNLPTTTIGSFPQTRDIRRLRVDLRKNRITAEDYEKSLQEETIKTIRFQEEANLDVLVHGEFERKDMVEYFGEQLEGYVFTQHGWVQSYGSRGVKPPVIYGDIVRQHPMTVKWSKFAKDHTDHPMKGMLTGPVTMLQWSFVRDDQPREKTCEQLALVIRDEVVDLEAAGIEVIQIDEPAIREGLPLRRADWNEYLDWAIRCFRIASSGVKDDTQIHTHMCYSEFNDMMESIAAMDADVISIEASRSKMELLDVFDQSDFVYPNDIGPGIYDIHSPRVPSVEEMVDLLRAALKHVSKDRLWVNPDCGLKTRGWEETEAALINMVNAAKIVREEINKLIR